MNPVETNTAIAEMIGETTDIREMTDTGRADTMTITTGMAAEKGIETETEIGTAIMEIVRDLTGIEKETTTGEEDEKFY